MPIDSVGSTYSNQYIQKQSATMAEDNTSLSISDFYQLLAAQLKYQDADNPMDTSEMMAQMVQTQMVEAINTMSTISTTTYAASMIGHEVTVAEVNSYGQYTGKSSGIVTGVVLGSDPIIYIGENAYSLSQIMLVGKEPSTTGDTVNPPTEGENTETENPEEASKM